ncbi:MAG TPA: YihY/virulence factor BrkB family protein [Polyangiaceae bacterium]|nr:YihY/virulence factor BrkB family protein [Polyangiaceae bacterium]
MKSVRFDWKGCCRHLWREISEDQIANGAAALAFYMVLALFPSAIFGLSALAYLPIPHLQQAATDLVHESLPASAADLVMSTVQSVISERNTGLLSFGFVTALWSATSGVRGLMQQLNVAYEVAEQRSFLRTQATALLLTFAFFALVLGALALIIFGGMLQSYVGVRLGWSDGLLLTFAGLRWLIIVAALNAAFALIYSFGPNLKQRFMQVIPGCLAATASLLIASIAFKVYVEKFSDYGALYGGLGGVIVLLLWLFSAGWSILFGAELNDALRQKPRAPSRESAAAACPRAPRTSTTSA